MATQTQEWLSRADAAWLHMESPTNHFVVTSVAILDAPLDFDRLLRVVRRRVALHPRLRRVVVEPALPWQPPRLRDDPAFDVRAHVGHTALPGAAGKAELEAMIGDLCGRPLDLTRPLWEVHLVDGLGAGSAVVSRFHHSLGDGQALVRLLLSMTDGSAGGWRRAPRRPRGAARDRPWVDSLLGLLRGAPGLASKAPAALGTIARLSLLDADPPTPFRGRLGRLKAVAWSRPVDLAAIKRIARAEDATLNDVVVSAIAGALGTHLRSAGALADGARIRAMVPVNIRDQADRAPEGNRFSLVFLELPVGVADAHTRLMRVKIEMDRIKASLEPAVGWLMIQGFGFLPPALEGAASAFYAGKASLVLTNVVGPQRPLWLGGCRIREMAFWEPESGGLGVGVSIFSYDGRLTVGVISDVGLVPRPRSITEAFEAEILGR